MPHHTASKDALDFGEIEILLQKCDKLTPITDMPVEELRAKAKKHLLEHLPEKEMAMAKIQVKGFEFDQEIKEESLAEDVKQLESTINEKFDTLNGEFETINGEKKEAETKLKTFTDLGLTVEQIQEHVKNTEALQNHWIDEYVKYAHNLGLIDANDAEKTVTKKELLKKLTIDELKSEVRDLQEKYQNDNMPGGQTEKTEKVLVQTVLNSNFAMEA